MVRRKGTRRHILKSEVELQILQGTDEQAIIALQHIRHDLGTIRRVIWPLRDTLTTLGRGDEPRFGPETQLYLRDTLDHVERALDIVEDHRDTAASLVDLFLGLASHRMNDVMKLLTVLGTIFLPLSFMTGLYGMNFDPSSSAWSMPELATPYGYPVLIGAMLLVAGALLAWFHRLGWLRTSR